MTLSHVYLFRSLTDEEIYQTLSDVHWNIVTSAYVPLLLVTLSSECQNHY